MPCVRLRVVQSLRFTGSLFAYIGLHEIPTGFGAGGQLAVRSFKTRGVCKKRGDMSFLRAASVKVVWRM